MNKRKFLKLGITGLGGMINMNNDYASNMLTSQKPWKWSREAIHYTNTAKGVKCLLCPNECVIREGNSGTCKNRVNYREKLYTIAYGNPCAMHVDPIEKKPLMHFFPGTEAFSIATAGCNLACLNCQNYDISQVSPKETTNVDLMPAAVVEQCIKRNCQSIAYTYTEPVSFYEYVYDTAKIAKEKNLKNIFISNGYINEKPLRELSKYLDGANINLKSFNDDIYLKLNAGKLQPVLNTLKILKEENVWLEITNLVIPSWTDDLSMIKRMCEWLVSNGLDSCPLHFSRFHPAYKLAHLQATPVNVLNQAKEIALKAGCKYVYVGNVVDPKASNTYCPFCKSLLIERQGYKIAQNLLKDNKCKCGKTVAGIW